MATLAEGRKAVACSRPLDPKSTQRHTMSPGSPGAEGSPPGGQAVADGQQKAVTEEGPSEDPSIERQGTTAASDEAGTQSVGVAAPARAPAPRKSRNWTLEEVLVACMAASRANMEMGEAKVETRAAAMARFFRSFAEQLEQDEQWNVFKTEGKFKVYVSPAAAAAERNILITDGRNMSCAILSKAQSVWSTSLHVTNLMDTMLVTNSETQESAGYEQ